MSNFQLPVYWSLIFASSRYRKIRFPSKFIVPKFDTKRALSNHIYWNQYTRWIVPRYSMLTPRIAFRCMYCCTKTKRKHVFTFALRGQFPRKFPALQKGDNWFGVAVSLKYPRELQFLRLVFIAHEVNITRETGASRAQYLTNTACRQTLSAAYFGRFWRLDQCPLWPLCGSYMFFKTDMSLSCSNNT